MLLNRNAPHLLPTKMLYLHGWGYYVGSGHARIKMNADDHDLANTRWSKPTYARLYRLAMGNRTCANYACVTRGRSTIIWSIPRKTKRMSCNAMCSTTFGDPRQKGATLPFIGQDPRHTFLNAPPLTRIHHRMIQTGGGPGVLEAFITCRTTTNQNNRL